MHNDNGCVNTVSDNTQDDAKTKDQPSDSHTTLPDTQFSTRKLQHEDKHSSDFGVTGNWNKTKEIEYQQAIQNHINSAPDIYKSTYRGDDVYVYFNGETRIGAYVGMDGEYIGGWKFFDKQIQFHLNNGTKIK